MESLYDPVSVMQTLRKGIEKGYWTLEDLDTPPPGFVGDPANHRNLLRAHPIQERVQASPDPRDFASDPRAELPADGTQVSPAEPRVDHSIDDLDPVSWDEL